ncbi:MAG: hypothetical protein ACT4OV_08295 [Microthrixaceae bacterium]
MSRASAARALPRLAIALGALALAWVVAASVPAHTPWYGGRCGSVSDWTSNEDIACNAPLLDRAGIVVAAIAIAALVVLDGFVTAPRSRSVRAMSAVAWTVTPVIALLAVNRIFDDVGWPHALPALVTLAIAVAILVVVPVSAARDWRARATVLAIAGLASAGLFAYAQMLWGGNGA